MHARARRQISAHPCPAQATSVDVSARECAVYGASRARNSTETAKRQRSRFWAPFCAAAFPGRRRRPLMTTAGYPIERWSMLRPARVIGGVANASGRTDLLGEPELPRNAKSVCAGIYIFARMAAAVTRIPWLLRSHCCSLRPVCACRVWMEHAT